jgi:hypothetical protein
MPIPDIFDFDASELAHYDQERVDKALREHSAIYISHLHVARQLTGWADRMESQGVVNGSISAEFEKGYIEALRTVAAQLRQAGYVPGGYFLPLD